MLKKLALVAALAAAYGTAHAGPVLIDGTDANDHGSFSSGANQDGWFYMQRGLENLASQVSSSVAKVVTVVGTTAGSNARNSITSAFNFSSLVAAGWTINYVDATNAFFQSLSTTTTGILYLPTQGQTGGDLTTAAAAVLTANAALINAFVGGAGNASQGGALFSHSQSYGWLSTLIPGLTVVGSGDTGLTLTGDGNAAFPGLTNQDLSTGPWHNYFTSTGAFGGLSVLATGVVSGQTRAVILGGGAGTVIGCGAPGQEACPPSVAAVPEPSTYALLALGLGMLGFAARRRAKA